MLVIEAGTIERGSQPLLWAIFSNRVTGVRLEEGVVLTDHAWYNLSQIAGRSGIADTYTNSEVSGWPSVSEE